LLNLHDNWERATREERKMLVRSMIQEAGCDVGTKRIVWVKARPDYEPLFSILDCLRVDKERRYWIERREVEGNICDIQEDSGQMSAGIEILLPVSDKTLSCNNLTIEEEHVQRRACTLIARSLSSN
jgi:hypothetical protein